MAKSKTKLTTRRRRVMIAYLRMKTGKAAINGQCPSNTELFCRCEDLLKLSSGLGMTKAERMERIVFEIQRQEPEMKAPIITRAEAKKKAALFYHSDRWKELRYRVLKLNNGHCECCGRGKEHGVVLHVDHIKPRSRYPDLQWSISNLQVLCADCNLGKRAWDETDWREPRLVTLMGERIGGLNS